MDIKYLLNAIWKRKWIVLVAGLIAALTALFFTRNMLPKYASVAQVSTGFTSNDDVSVYDDPVRSTAYETDIRFANVIQQFNSPNVLNLLSYDAMIHDLDAELAPFRPRLVGKGEFAGMSPASVKDVLINHKLNNSFLKESVANEKRILELIFASGYSSYTLATMVKVSRVQRTDFLNIEANAENGPLSAFLANNLIQNCIGYSRNIKENRSEESIEFLDSLMRSKKAILDKKLGTLNSYKSSMGLLNSDVQGISKIDMIRQFETELIGERNNLKTLKLTSADIGRRLREYKSSGGNSLKGDIVTLRNKIEDLEEVYLKGGEKDENLAAQIKDLKNEYTRKVAEVSDITTTVGQVSKEQLQDRLRDLDISIVSSEQKINAYEGKLAQLRGDARGMASAVATQQAMQLEVNTAEDDYNKVLSKYNVAKTKSAGTTNNLKQTIVAEIPGSPLPSKRNLIVALAGIGMIGLLSAFFALRQLFDNSIKSPSSFSRQVNLKILGVISAVDLKEHSIKELVNASTLKGPGGKNRENHFREALRKLRYEIEKSGRKCILFTSTESGQGKTTLIQALSYSMSLSNKKVLIIDTNFCNNDLTVQLGAKTTLEKADLNKANINAQYLSEIATPLSENIDVIGCKGGDYTPNEILPKNNILLHLDYLKGIYDFIFVEGAPLNGFTDSKELEPYVDGILVIFSAANVYRHEDEMSLTFIRGKMDKFIGAILNKVADEDLNV